MEKYHATQLIVKAFQEKKIRFRVEQLGRQEEIQAGFQVDCGPFVTVRFISLDDDNDVAIRALGIVGGVPKEKRLRVLEACNEINCKRRFLKFVLDRDGDVNVEYDFLMRADDGCIGEMACEVFAITMHLIDKDYPLLMKAIYTDEPVCGEENLRMRERMAAADCHQQRANWQLYLAEYELLHGSADEAARLASDTALEPLTPRMERLRAEVLSGLEVSG